MVGGLYLKAPDMLLSAVGAPVEPPAVSGTVADYVTLRVSLAAVSNWLIVPSMALVLLSGLFAMAIHFPYQNALWVWLKLLGAFLIFESTLATVDGPARKAAAAAARLHAGDIDTAGFNSVVTDYWGAWWVILALCVANVALGVWRPRFGSKRS